MTQWGLDTLFNPAKRHMDEEKRRLLSTREQLGDSSGGKRIDLESGKVRISKAGKDDPAEDEPHTDESHADEPAEAAADGKPAPSAAADRKPAPSTAAHGKPAPSAAADGKPAPSPAQIRAAQRRGRKPRAS